MQTGNNIVGVQFEKVGKIYNFSYKNISLKIGDMVLVETKMGKSIATIVAVGYLGTESLNKRELKPIIKKIESFQTISDFPLLPGEISAFATRAIKRHKLDMKVLKSEILYGGGRIVISFSSSERVDFRDLVKDLAKGLKARVELKQIGARDSTKVLGGKGICGREYCCSTFLREFIPISIKMAKNQNLAINPSKVSGGCGRLLCCLTYENDFYLDLRRKLPPIGTKVFIPKEDTEGEIVRLDILNQKVQVAMRGKATSSMNIDEINIVKKVDFVEDQYK